jgi:hypothetical protein
MNRRQELALAKALIHSFAARVADEGLPPDDPVTGRVIAAMLAIHYTFHGGGETYKRQLIDQVREQLNVADQMSYDA